MNVELKEIDVKKYYNIELLCINESRLINNSIN